MEPYTGTAREGTLIALRDVTIGGRDGQPLLTGVDVVFPSGAISAVVGPSGSGKTQLLFAILGLIAPLGGTLRVDDIDPEISPLAVRRSICFVAHSAPTLDHLSVLEQVRALLVFGNEKRIHERDIVRALRLCDIPDRLMRKRSSRLSSYERLCVWLAIHRLRGTSVLMLDDPATALSGRLARSFARLLRENLTEGRSVVLTGRDPGFAVGLAERIFRIDQGRLDLQVVTPTDPNMKLSSRLSSS